MNDIIFKTILLKGEAGNDISSIEKTASAGLVDTYTVTLTDGTTTTFEVTNGNGIKRIAKTSTSGIVDTYTITYDDGTTSTFTVTNGRGISNIAKTSTSGLADIYTITYNDGTTSTFTVTNSNTEPLISAIRTNLINTILGTKTQNGITITYNGDGTYTVNGTASANTTFVLLNWADFEVGKDYKILGTPSGGGASTYKIGVYGDASTQVAMCPEYGNTHDYFTSSDTYSLYRVQIVIYSGTVCDNLVFKPMITTDLTATYDDFVEYSGYGELNENVADLYNEFRAYETDITKFGTDPANNGVLVGKTPNLKMLAKNNLLKSAYIIGSEALSGHPSDKPLADCVAIGTRTMYKNFVGAHNIAIGSYALANIKGDPVNYGNGDRNVAIGSLCYLFAESVRRSVGMGRDVAQNMTEGDYNTNIGYATLGGYAHIGLEGEIVNAQPMTLSKVTTLGAQALIQANNGDNTVGIGAYCSPNVKNSRRNVFIGSNALMALGEDISYNGKKYVTASDSATYECTNGSTILVTCSGHQAVVDNYVRIKFTSGNLTANTTEEQLLYVSAVTSTTFTLTTDYTTLSGSGNCTINGYETNGDVSDYDAQENVVIGNNAGQNIVRLVKSTLIGSQVLDKATNVKYTTAIGRNIGYDGLINCEDSVFVGNGVVSDANATQCTKSVGVGESALMAFGVGDKNTAMGYNAGRYMVDGSTGANVSNSTCIGYNSRVSGSNEIQLGDGNATPYAYNALQIRSDRRDKCDIVDNPLGLDFINALRPVQYKTNFRDLYEDFDNSTEEFKGNRLHNGFIAQEVKKVADDFGIDFAGYQDHTINGGSDVKSLSYTELIAPMVKAIQELSNKVNELQNQVNKLTK